MIAPFVHWSATAWSPSVACGRGLVALALAGASFVWWASAPAPASAQPAPKAEQPAQPTATPIPVPEIAQRAEEVATLLRQSAERLATDPEVLDVDNRLPAASEWIRGRLVAAAQTVDSSPSPSALANLSDSWMVMRSELARWNDTLARRTTHLERAKRARGGHACRPRGGRDRDRVPQARHLHPRRHQVSNAGAIVMRVLARPRNALHDHRPWSPPGPAARVS